MKPALLLLLAVNLFIACKKDPEPSRYWGEATAIINGKPWTAHPIAWLSPVSGNNCLIEIDSIDQFAALRQGLDFFKVPFKPGTHPVVNSDSQVDDTLVGADFYYLDYDVLYGNYKILEADSSSFVNLQSYDSITKELRGSFNLTFIATLKPAGEPDTLRVRNGTFHTRVREQ